MNLKVKPKYKVSNKERFVAYSIAGIGALIILSLCASFLIDNNSYFEHNNIKLSMNDYESIQQTFGGYQNVIVCNMDQGGCLILSKLKGEVGDNN